MRRQLQPLLIPCMILVLSGPAAAQDRTAEFEKQKALDAASEDVKGKENSFDAATTARIDAEDPGTGEEAADFSADLVSPASVVNAFFDVISGEAGQEMDILRLYNLFTPNAGLVPMFLLDQGIAMNTQIHPLVFLLEFGPRMIAQGHREEVISIRTEEFGRIAQAFTVTMASRDQDGNRLEERAVTFFQLVNYGLGWKISNMIREAESDKYQIPDKYLK